MAYRQSSNFFAINDNSTLMTFIGPTDLAFYAVTYDKTLGCSVWNTSTGTATKFAGITGTITDLTGAWCSGKVLSTTHKGSMMEENSTWRAKDASQETRAMQGGDSRKLTRSSVGFGKQECRTRKISRRWGLTTWPSDDNTNCGHSMPMYNLQPNKCIFTSTGVMEYFLRLPDDSSYALLDTGQSLASTCYGLNSSTPSVCPNDDQHISKSERPSAQQQRASPMRSAPHHQQPSTRAAAERMVA